MTCPDCVSGTIHSGTPKGTEIKVAGFNAYATGDENSNRVIMIGVDIFGWKFVNTRLLADEYASHGFRVIMADLFNGAFDSATRIACLRIPTKTSLGLAHF